MSESANALAPSRDGPVVSFIVPVHNHQAYLDESLRSARNQTVRDIEIIVVDDGSTDDSIAIAERHAAEDSRVRLLRLDHRGVSAARNAGLEAARASWVAFLDADDVARPERVERQITYLTGHPEVSVIGSYARRIGRSGHEFGYLDGGPTSPAEFAVMKARNEPLFLLPSSVMASRDVLLAAGGFRTSLRAAQDVDLWTRLADSSLLLVLPEHLVRYRVHPQAISSTRFFEQSEEALRVGANAARRRAGEIELDSGEYHAMLAARPRLERFRRWAEWRSRYCYRVAAELLADRRPSGVLWLGAAVVVQPQLFPPRAAHALRWLLSRVRSTPPSPPA